MFAIVDCNNFYVSCERLFRPDLREKPVIVLSNNDGCVIARSNEAKALGLKMGEPYFKIAALCTQYQITIFSSNYPLYADLSHRVMQIIENAWPDMAQYSIDEAFLDLGTMAADQHEYFCQTLHASILKCTGIPTSIGIGPTKTLAKIANYLCKRKLQIPVFTVNPQSDWLQQIAVGDIWGIGRQWSKQLHQYQIQSAADLSRMDPHTLKQKFNIALTRTAMELQGIACFAMEEQSPPKTIVSSRSFGDMQTEVTPIAHALSRHVATAYEKLRTHGLLVKTLSVFLTTNNFRPDLPQYNPSIQCHFITPTDDIRVITHTAKQGLKKIFKKKFFYKKVGLCFDVLVSQRNQQLDLFYQPSEASLEKKEQLLTMFDNINQKFGRKTIKLAAEGNHSSEAMRQEQLSPRYTTTWHDLPTIKNRT